MQYKQLSLPLQLTLIRLIGSPLVLPFFLVYLLPFNNILINSALSILFLAFCATDFFDGYLARKNNQETVLGGMLDHIADKFLLYSVLIALVAVHKLYFFWAIVWIGREFFIMALRQIALENNFSVAVSSFGKSKTALQFICLAVVIANPYHCLPLGASWLNGGELLLLLAATALSIGSGYHYGHTFYQQMRHNI